MLKMFKQSLVINWLFFASLALSLEYHRPNLEDEINRLLAEYNYGTPSFLGHVHFFAGSDGVITQTDISPMWSALSGESCIEATIKAWITLQGAHKRENHNKCEYVKRGKYKDWGYKADIMMGLLKHDYDLKILNADGSIKIDQLKKVALTCSEWNDAQGDYIIRRSAILNYLTICQQEDSDMKKPNVISLVPLLPTAKIVAVNEWMGFYKSFSHINVAMIDNDQKEEPAVLLATFINFYINPIALHNKAVGLE